MNERWETEIRISTFPPSSNSSPHFLFDTPTSSTLSRPSSRSTTGCFLSYQLRIPCLPTRTFTPPPEKRDQSYGDPALGDATSRAVSNPFLVIPGMHVTNRDRLVPPLAGTSQQKQATTRGCCLLTAHPPVVPAVKVLESIRIPDAQSGGTSSLW